MHVQLYADPIGLVLVLGLLMQALAILLASSGIQSLPIIGNDWWPARASLSEPVVSSRALDMECTSAARAGCMLPKVCDNFL